MDDLARISPAELLVSERQSAQFGEIAGALAYDDFAFLTEHARFTLCEHFGSNRSTVSAAATCRRRLALRARSFII